MSLSILSAVVTGLLVVFAFAGALFNFEPEILIASFFVLSLLAFVAALCLFVHEAIIALGEFQQYL
jgi:hypothetical protein